MNDNLKNVDEYLERQTKEARTVLIKIRSIIKACSPDATELINYGIVGYKLKGQNRAFLFFAGYKDHVSLHPVPKSLPSELEEKVNTFKTGKGTISFKLGSVIPYDLIKIIVQSLFNDAQ